MVQPAGVAPLLGNSDVLVEHVGDGTHYKLVKLVGGGATGGPAATVPPVMAVLDSAATPKRWVMVTDYQATPATVTFYEFGTTTVGAPTLPVLPDDDANAATEATQQLLLAALRKPAFEASGFAPIAGTVNAVGPVAASVCTPQAGRSFNVYISFGPSVMTVQLQRSLDGGTTWTQLTVFGETVMTFDSANNGIISEGWDEDQAGVQYRLVCTAYTSGTAAWRISQ